MAMKNLLLTLALVLLAMGCAKSSKDIRAQYVSPLEYKDYDCDQIVAEMRRLSRRVAEIGGSVDKTASGDKVTMSVGLLVFPPLLFLLDGDNVEAQEYGRLKGEYEALQAAATQKKCAMSPSK